ncbi:serine/threonine-protein kinase [Nonomuraea endophytica]|uniref:Putative Ser/Thr protein kinase n=1 Tax=Nonomuraea endophytica TaxID=714136 RepID=A0A7W8ACS1_9ACTN|nr:serine/threonine-protein kinase [Nonomuraea endophytica]MBB5083864.1 putative Ser/Thr protein kinase [Nonomuraea endophytica]
MLPLAAADPGQIDVYSLSGVLGRGGQGSVYLGEDDAGVKVAVKVLHSQVADEDAHRRFLREAEAARRVAPFCTARVLDVGVSDGRPYIVSEHITGPSLERMVKGDGARFGSGLERLAVATLTALAAIHRAGVVHRDFKPGNVIMGAEGPVVIDFGIARALDQTATSSVMGTPAFMAPEQFAGGVSGPAVDLFSWASTMVFAATGAQAFKGDTMPSLMHAILTAEPDLSGVPHDLRPLLQACLNKDPAQRPTADGLLATLTGAPSGPQAMPTVPISGPQGAPVQGTIRMEAGPPLRRQPPAPVAGGGRSAAGVVHRIAAVTALICGAVVALSLFGQTIETVANWIDDDYETFLGMTSWLMITVVSLLLYIPAYTVAAWRHSVAAAICMAMTVPPALVFIFWGLALGDNDLPAFLLAVVPGVLIGLMISVSALLLWRFSLVAALLGVAAGGLVAVEALGFLVVRLPGSLPDLFYDLVQLESMATSVTLGAWALVTPALLVLRAGRAAAPKVAA